MNRNTKQERQYTYNVTFRCVHETTHAVEKQQVLHISVCACMDVCLHTYPYLPSMPCAGTILSATFLAIPHFLTSQKCTIFGKKLPNMICAF
jgi:hypothetical protein